jgi:hypothetical protein
MTDGGAAGAAAVADLGKVRDIARADVLGQGDLIRRFHGERGKSVDLTGCDPGVAQSGDDGLTGQLGLRPVNLLGELGLPDTDDGRGVLENRSVGLGHHG